MIEVKKETVEDVLDEIQPLLQTHWEEVAANKDKVPLDMDVERYRLLEQAGALAIYTLRKEGCLVGYNIFIVSPHIHYKSTTFAINDILFVKPEYRGTRSVIRLLVESEEDLKRQGASVVHYHMKMWKPFQRLMEALDYSPVEVLYGKYIGD